MMSALTDREWNGIVKFMGAPPWAKNERFSQFALRSLHGDEIGPHVEEFVLQYKKEDLFHQLQANALAASPVNTAEDVVKSTQMGERGFFSEIDHPEAGRLKYPTVSYKYSKTPCSMERAAPLLGQHNEFIYCGRLGYDKQDLVKMRESGII